MRKATGIVILVLAAGIAGCSNKGLMDLRSSTNGPDEFLVLPNKPLEQPREYSSLPQPTPGGGNLIDPNPKADAVAALGGRPSWLDAQGIPASDSALVTQVSRNGVPRDIRATLAAADAKFRKRQARGTRIRLFPVDRYRQAYRRSALKPFDVTEQFRRSGFQTPTSPPERP